MATDWEAALRAGDATWQAAIAAPGAPVDAAAQLKLDQAVAGATLVEMLIDLKRSGHLRAKELCILAYWIYQAGPAAADACRDLAFRPNAPTGHYSRHLDLAQGIERKDKRLYPVYMPIYSRHSLTRKTETLYALPPHERLQQELLDHPEVVSQHLDAVASGNLPPSFFRHADFAVDDALPLHSLTMYSDSTEFVHGDSMWAVYVYFTLTGRRHVCLLIRKSQFCQCGCRGWCTQFEAWRFLAWSFSCCRRGWHPNSRHDNLELDDARSEFVGKRLNFRGILSLLKGDNAELAAPHGFPTTKDGNHPCILCWAKHCQMFHFKGLTNSSGPFPKKTRAQLEAATKKCEIWVTCDTHDDYLRIRACLDYDKRKEGFRGRALDRPLPDFGLHLGDRLEPSPAMPNIGAGFDKHDTFPVKLLFWRRKNETLSRHRNPLFEPETGINPYEVICIDGMHTNSEGTLQQFCSFVVHHCHKHDIWRVGRVIKTNLFVYSMMRLLQDFKKWRNQQSEDIQDLVLTTTTFGSVYKPAFHLKAGQTNIFLKFIISLVEEHYYRLPKAGVILECGKSLLWLITGLKGKGFKLLEEDKRLLMQNIRNSLFHAAGLGIHMIPKHHLCMHWGLCCDETGNPDLTTCWQDEHLNGVLRPVAAHAHAINFTARVLSESLLIMSSKKPFMKKKRRKLRSRKQN